MRVVLSAAARNDLREATDWYAARSQQVARRFVGAYKHARSLIAEAPQRWAESRSGVRRVLLQKFPYSLLYVIEEERVLVLAVMHHKRHPDFWRGR